MPTTYDDLIPTKKKSTGLYDDLIPVEEKLKEGYDDLIPAKTQLEKDVEQYGAWNAAPPPSKWGEFKHWFRKQVTPFIGPSERQIAEEGVMWTDPVTGQSGKMYKPLADKFTKQGLFNTPLIGDLKEKVGIDAKDLEEFGVSEEWAKGIAGTQRGILGATEQITNPLVAVAAAASGGAPLLGKVLAGGFSEHMAYGLNDVRNVFNEAVEAGDTQAAAEALTGGVLQAFFAFKAGQHATQGGGAKIKAFHQKKLQPELKKLLTHQIKTEYTGPQLRVIFSRVNKNQGTPAEVEMVKFINGEMKPGALVKKGAKTTFTSAEAKMFKNSKAWKNFLGIEDVKVPVATRLISEKAGTKAPVEAPPSVGKYFKLEEARVPVMLAESKMGIPAGTKTSAIPPEVVEPDWFSKSIGPVKNVYKKWLTSKGRLKFTDPTSGLTVDVYTRKGEMGGNILSELKHLDNVSAKLRRAEKKAYGKDNPKPEDLMERMNSFLANEKVDLPKPIQKVLTEMRAHRKGLSKEIQKLVTGELKTTIGDNMEVYLHRSYEIFDDPKFKEKILKGKKVEGSRYEVAKEFLANERQADLIAEAQKKVESGELAKHQIEGYVDRRLSGEMEAMLNVAGRDIFEAIPSSGRVLDVVKKRKNIPVEIRELWGEHKDPYVNYARTVTKMSQFIETTKFYQELREAGLNRFLWEKPFEGFSEQIGGGEKFAVKKDGSLGKKLASNPRLAPIDGLYTTKELAKAFTSLDELGPLGTGLERALMIPSAAANMSATVLNHVTQNRNVHGGGMMSMANNRLSPKQSVEALKTIGADILKLDSKAQLEKIQEYAKLDFFDQAAVPTEMLASIKDVLGKEKSAWLEDISSGRINLSKGGRILAKAGKLPFEVYQGVDTAFRIANFEVELARYSKALKIDPKNPQLRQDVANIIKDTYPTYSRVPLSIKALRRFPYLGAFISFPAEIIRTTKNTYSLSMKELATPGLREIGAKRFAAMTGTLMLPEITRQVFNNLSGVSSEEEKALRRFFPWWSKNGTPLISKEKNGHYNYFDLKYSDPYSYLKEPLVAAMRAGGEPDVHYWQAFGALIQPFTDEKIFASKLFDVARNITESGRPVWGENDSLDERTTKILAHLGEAITPGAAKSINRLHKAATDQKGDFGREYDLSREAFAQFGFRTSKLDIGNSLAMHKLPQSKRKINGYSGDFTREMRRTQLNDAQQLELYTKVNEDRFKEWQTVHRDIQAAQTLGVGLVTVELALQKSGFNKDEREALRNGTFIPYWPSDEKALELQTERRTFNRVNLLGRYTELLASPLLNEN